jgi:dienelactone hydrolase
MVSVNRSNAATSASAAPRSGLGALDKFLQAGPHKVSQSLEFFEHGKGEVQYQLYRPADPSMRKRSVVVLGHGFALSPKTLDAYANNLASRGYVVVAPSFGKFASNHGDNAKTMLATLDAVSALHPSLVDTSNVAFGGHSAGGGSALLAAQDPSMKGRVRGVMLLDPVIAKQDAKSIGDGMKSLKSVPTVALFAEPSKFNDNGARREVILGDNVTTAKVSGATHANPVGAIPLMSALMGTDSQKTAPFVAAGVAAIEASLGGNQEARAALSQLSSIPGFEAEKAPTSKSRVGWKQR